MTASTETLEGRRIFVTGGTGFLGSAFIRHAVEAGAAVRALVRPGADRWRLVSVEGRYASVVGGLQDLALIPERELDAPELFVHCAAAGVNQCNDDVSAMVETNVVGTLRALQCAQRVGVGRFVHIGSSGEYGPGNLLTEGTPLRPASEYGASRAAATLLAQAFGARRGLDVVVLRPFAVYGPYEAAFRLVPYCILRGLQGTPLQISSGVQTRDYVYVDDVVNAIIRASVLDGVDGRVFNICTGVETAVGEVAGMIARLTGGGSKVESAQRPDNPGEMWRTVGDPTQAGTGLAWSAGTALQAGISQAIDWFRTTGRHVAVYRQHE